MNRVIRPKVETSKNERGIADDLVKAQFAQLIDTIKSTRERIHQITVSAIVGLPATIFLAKAFQESSVGVAANIIVMISPFIIAAFGLFYVSEKAAMKRYGHYIAIHIDPLMTDENRPTFKGWHTTIRHDPSFKEIIEKTRDYDACKALGMALLVSVYFFAALFASGNAVATYLSTSRLYFTQVAIIVSLIEATVLLILWRYRHFAYRFLDNLHF